MYSPCSPTGPWIRYTDKGYIEVQNIGIPLYTRFPKRVNQWKSIIDANAIKWKISPSIIAAFMAQESQGNENAVSPSNAYGLMQMILTTARNWGSTYFGIDRNTITVQSLFDPELNIKLATAGLSGLMNKYNGNLVRVAAEYNSGGNYCGEYCNTNKETGVSVCCSNRWGLKTNCGYTDGIIKYNNTAIDLGYSGVPILVSKSYFWPVLAFVGAAVVGGAFVHFGAKKGLFLRH